MDYERLISVNCLDQSEVNEAINYWVNVRKYKRVYTAKCSLEADYYVRIDATNWTKSADNRNGETIIIIFGK